MHRLIVFLKQVKRARQMVLRQARRVQCGEFLRVTNRRMVLWIAALSIAVLLLLALHSVSRRRPAQRPVRVRSGGTASWLQAAETHVRSVAQRDVAHSEGNRTSANSTSRSTRRYYPWPQPIAGIDSWFKAAETHARSPARLGDSGQAGSVNITKPSLHPRGFQLSNLRNFTFLINNDVCGYEPVDMVVLVTSDARWPSWRAGIRDALPSSVLAELRVRRVFLLARLEPMFNASLIYDRRMATLQAENHEHADLVVGNFRDSYRNLTYKHLMGLRWATDYCPQARYIIKMDHDIVADLFQLSGRLAKLAGGIVGPNVIIGATFSGAMPRRDPKSKYFVTYEEYVGETYPDYMSGWMYIITPGAAAKLVAAGNKQPFFWVDDAFVTGVLRDREAPDIQMIDFEQLWMYEDNNTFYSPYTMEIACLYECAAEAEASFSRCSTLFGPVWDNRVVMRLFYKHTAYCHRHGCPLRRPPPPVCAYGVGYRDLERLGMPVRSHDIGDTVTFDNATLRPASRLRRLPQPLD